ncbi:phosphate ABC transporter permease PstA [Pseudothauera rhizosphaerae]|uniref:Phosphate transport system permease protein PstA n=1 Tax=Pseudothauera rhizosphaerae TaxID=2565932 RepID=A0A4S4AS59_9RHOO|nr:phosphate ABC transporter permease PstA [Pseudothauera rhizosphaerae]THF62548.1 phosphate ABC transporter permease PstA [Pseudothauera rhizosphaerae]
MHNDDASAPRTDPSTQRRLVERSLARRHGAEKRFRAAGLAAVFFGLGMVALLFASILAKGVPAFWQATVVTEVYFDPEIIKVDPRPVAQPGETPAQLHEREMAWQTQLTMANWNRIIENTLAAHLPEVTDARARARLRQLVTSGERFVLRDRVIADPALIGQRLTLKLLADANVDVWLKGNIDRSLPDSQQQLAPDVRAWADQLHERGVIQMKFNTTLFGNPDSRSSLASAGLAGAFVGSLFMMAIVILLAVPVGVASAVYLEEFAPRNRFTDLIEVNINNLAAVPSIIFGLLGAAVFINWFHMPLSAPIVGGLVLSLMTLPTVIIATRSTLQAIPPSIRQAALGIGASKVQMILHHVLPLALPGILTGAIIGVAQAIGETAPLLLIGMSAFVAAVPATPFDQSTALPVQIYLWQGNELRNFFEARTSAAIIVLLGLMLSLNALAIWLRKRFEKRW